VCCCAADEELIDDGWSATPQPSGAAVSLDGGLSVSVPAARAGATWSFDVLTRNPTVVAAEVRSATSAVCPVPPYAAGAPDGDPATPGLQHEVRVSQRGAGVGPFAHAFTAEAGSSPRGALPPSRDTALLAAGFPGGDGAVTYEMRTTDGATWQWRRYTGDLPVTADKTDWMTPASGTDVEDAVDAWVPLGGDVFVRFATAANKTAGTHWLLVAQPAWSTAFSPVAWTPADPALAAAPPAVPSTWLLPSGLPRASDTGGVSYNYELTLVNGRTAFTWRRWPYGGDATSATAPSAPLPVPQLGDPPAPLGPASGISVAWSSPGAVADGDVYAFTAFAGHAVTYAATPALGPVIAAAGTISAPPLATGALGDPYGAAYTGVAAVTFTLTVGANRTTFTWSADGGLTRSAPADIGTDRIALAYGVHVTWPSGGAYTAGDAFSFWAAPVASSVAPPVPTPPDPGFAPVGAFAPGGAAPPADVAVGVEFASASTFVYRLDLGPWSAPPQAVASGPVALGATGLALRFGKLSGYTPGQRFVLWVSSFVPLLDNATTAHAGARAEPATGTPAPARSNRGAGVGLALPDAANTGPPALGMTVLPTPGFATGGMLAAFGAGGAGGGGLAAPLPAGYAASTAPGAFPVIQVRVIGAPSLGAVAGPLSGELDVSGDYIGTDSTVYTLEAVGVTDFRWRAAPLGGTAGAWNAATVRPTTATDIGDGLGVKIAFGGGAYPDGTAWSFVAAAGHTFSWRREGAASWSAESVIAPGANALCCGVSVAFDALSGYAPQDAWRLLPFSVGLEGAYSGEQDAALQMQILPGTAGQLPPSAAQITPLLTSALSITGAAATLIVGGVYTGTASLVFEVQIAVIASPEQFVWRRYPAGAGGSAVDWFEAPRDVSLAVSPALKLDGLLGLTLTWQATTGRRVGDTWRFVARSGDAFAWRDANAPGGDVWSAPLAVGNVGFFAAAPDNAARAVAVKLNDDVRCGGDYDGSAGPDASLAVEVTVNATAAFARWLLWPAPLPGVAAGERPPLADLALGAWSAPVALTGLPQAVGAGLWVSLRPAAPWAHGDVFLAPLAAPGAWRAHMAQGLAAAWSAPSGYTANDTWSVGARAALAARGPLEGGAELRIMGAGFTPGSAALCRLTDEPAGLAPAVFPAVAVAGGNELRCVTPPRAPDAVSAPLASGAGAPVVDAAGVGDAAAAGAAQDAHFRLRVGATLTLWLDDAAPGGERLPRLPLGANVTKLADGVTWLQLDALAAAAPGAVLANIAAWAPALSQAGPLAVRLQPGAYAAGQTWTFRRAALAAAAAAGGDAHPDLGGGGLKPGVLCSLAVSVDGGVTWAVPPAGAGGTARFLYSPVYASPDGDDGGGGDGTRGAPYRTLGRAVAASLSPARPGPPGAPAGLAGTTDWDALVLLPGRYAGAGNAGVAPAGRALVVQAAQRGAAVLDCAGAPGGDVMAGDRFAPPGPAGRGSITLRGVATENCGSAYAGGW
jgi:hypothetical protein